MVESTDERELIAPQNFTVKAGDVASLGTSCEIGLIAGQNLGGQLAHRKDTWLFMRSLFAKAVQSELMKSLRYKYARIYLIGGSAQVFGRSDYLGQTLAVPMTFKEALKMTQELGTHYTRVIYEMRPIRVYRKGKKAEC